MLHKRCGGKALGVDNAAYVVEVARCRFPAVRYELADGTSVEQASVVAPCLPLCHRELEATCMLRMLCQG